MSTFIAFSVGALVAAGSITEIGFALDDYSAAANQRRYSNGKNSSRSKAFNIEAYTSNWSKSEHPKFSEMRRSWNSKVWEIRQQILDVFDPKEKK